MQRQLVQKMVLPSLLYPSFLAKDGSKTDWTGKPSDWSDIRLGCPDNSIALYAAHAADYSQYDNLGFMATCVGGYNVFIDGVQYGSTYASGAQCNITWSTSGITTGDDITTPSALKAHKIWISPATAGNNITQFACRRVAASGTEQQGILWAHYNLSNKIRMLGAFSSSSNYKNQQLVAFTAKNNSVFVDASANSAFVSCSNLEYVPSFYGDGVSNYSFGATFDTCSKLKNVSLSNMKITEAYSMFNYCYDLESIQNSNVIVEFGSSSTLNNMYRDCYKLKSILPVAYNDKITNAANYITNASNLQDTIIDASGASNLTRIGTYGTSSRFMGRLKGLRVSSSAPFNNASSPQIDVSYTGMNRTALVQLFNDLPSVSSGQIINITGSTGASDLRASDISIATDKGWTVAGYEGI